MSIERARALRKNATDPEHAMWRLLYTFRRAGHNFRRQVPLGPYYADFACHGLNLIIEIDGDTHFTAAGKIHDATRDNFLRNEGYTILRFSNDDVIHNPEGVFDVVTKFVEAADI